jgi:hypothetical protein
MRHVLVLGQVLPFVGCALVGCALVGCAPIVDAQFSDIEVTRPNNKIPPAPTSAHSSVPFTFTLNSTTLGANANPDAQDGIVSVKLRRLSLTAKSGITDLSFIETFHALACVPISKSSTLSARQVEIADYARVSVSPASATFEVPIPEPVDLLPLLRPSSTEPRLILVIANLGGELPKSEWFADVSMALSIEVRQ